MAGKRDVEAAAAEPSPNTASKDPSSSPALPMTVMLSKTDGDAFEAAVRQAVAQAANQQPAAAAPAAAATASYRYHLDAQVSNMLLTSDLMGDLRYPKMFMDAKTVFVLGSGRWATLLKASTDTKNEDWQLYLLSKEDVYAAHLALIPPFQVRSPGGQPKSVPFTVLQDPMALYWHMHRRKCPGHIRVAANHDIYFA